MADMTAHAGAKRPRSETHTFESQPKRRKVHHRLHHGPAKPKSIEPAPQEPVFSQGQLLKSITAALTLAGFDAVQPSALEMFRSHTETYMLKLLEYVKTSMQGSRRTKATPSDFSAALAQMPNAAQASLLTPQLSLSIPEAIAFPSVAEPVADESPAPDLSNLLAPLVDGPRPKYIPRHFPQLPPRHAWQQTPVFPDRETDSRKMREKATQEGMMAEQALRKLAAAAKAGALKAERKKTNALSGRGKMREGMGGKAESKEDVFADVMKDIGGADSAEMTESHADTQVDVGMPEGVVVNYGMGHWRHGAARRAVES